MKVNITKAMVLEMLSYVPEDATDLQIRSTWSPKHEDYAYVSFYSETAVEGGRIERSGVAPHRFLVRFGS